jgi:thiazole tautomerase (transcriptional regulator TenI)
MTAPVPRLMLVVESARSALPFADLVAAAIEGGCDAIQIRDRQLPTEERRRRVAIALDLAATRALVIVNTDLAVAVEYDVGLHLPERGPAPSETRATLGKDALIGKSVHSAAAAAAVNGADYLVAGHVYPTPSHPGAAPLGLDGFARVVAASRIPVLAIGGVTVDRVAEVVAAGASGVAVIGAISAALTRSAATDAARMLRAALDDALAQSLE